MYCEYDDRHQRFTLQNGYSPEEMSDMYDEEMEEMQRVEELSSEGKENAVQICGMPIEWWTDEEYNALLEQAKYARRDDKRYQALIKRYPNAKW